ncbi:MAG: hypothetical protein IKS20_07575, partial [Victivallales bacterium]|nr:hypothetical protein [Victivallales bacterium]
YAKRLIDELYVYHRNDKRPPMSPFSNTLAGIFFYTGIVVLQKGCNEEPVSILSGNDNQSVSASALARENYGDSFIRKASFLRVGFWMVKMIYFFLTGNKELRNQYFRQLKIKFRI